MSVNASAAKQRKQRTQLVGVIGFILFVIVTGLIFKAADKLDDPFANMSDIVEMRAMLAETQQDDAANQVDESIGEDLVNAKTGYALTWSAGGEVLYDLWFICAVTAVFIVVSYFLKWIARQLARK